MKLTALRYFLAVVQEGSICAAANRVFVTQPTLSRQMMELEEELGKKLFERGKRRIRLTEEGRFLHKRAQEIVELVDRTRSAFASTKQDIAGDVLIGGGETRAMRFLARAAHSVQQEHPHVMVHLSSGNAQDTMEKLDRGLVDLGLFIEPVDLSRYDSFRLPATNLWGVLMRRDAPLADRTAIRPDDLVGRRLIVSRQTLLSHEFTRWFAPVLETGPAADGPAAAWPGADVADLRGAGSAGRPQDLHELSDWPAWCSRLNVVATYTLLYNASLMVEEGMGYCLCLDGIVRTDGESPLCFRPLAPAMEVGVSLAWKKYQVFSPAVEVFLEQLRRHCGRDDEDRDD